MSFPLSKLNSDDLISVLTKMEFVAFRNIRQTKPWIAEFIKKKRVKIHVEYATIRSQGFSHLHMGVTSFPNQELELVSPLCIMLYGSSVNSILSTDFSKFSHLQFAKIHDVEEDAVHIAFNKLLHENIPPGLSANFYDNKKPHDHRNCFLKHPILNRIKIIYLHHRECPSPDLSFLCDDHEKVHLRISKIPEISIIVKAIQKIIEGSIGTKLIDITMFDDNISWINTLLKEFPWKLIWSKKDNETSRLKDRKLDDMSGSYSFWSTPVVGGKVGGLAVALDGSQLTFKIFDSEEDYLDGIAGDYYFCYSYPY